MPHPIARVVDLLDPSVNRIRNMDVAEARKRVLQRDGDGIRAIRGSFALLAAEGALPVDEAVHLMGQVLDAVGYAHRQGVIHRDLTPGNVMISDAGLRRNAQVLDFGIGAFSDRRRREELARLTATNEAIGTPSYAAPTRCRSGSRLRARAMRASRDACPTVGCGLAARWR